MLIYIYLFITCDLCVSVFVTLASGIPLRFLFKNYMFFAVL
jgi:hypothetical protein